ncbi:Protein of unknown function, partial [Gryllus bimaculatus]
LAGHGRQASRPASSEANRGQRQVPGTGRPPAGEGEWRTECLSSPHPQQSNKLREVSSMPEERPETSLLSRGGGGQEERPSGQGYSLHVREKSLQRDCTSLINRNPSES